MTRAIFLDKDGTLVEDVPYNVDCARIRLRPTVVEGLRLLRDACYRLIVVSNQSGVARGFFPEAALAPVTRHLTGLLADTGVSLDAFYYCPHHPEGAVPAYAVPCACRKPAPGLLRRAAAEGAIDLSASWMVGDQPADVEAGRRAGCRTVLIHDDPNALERMPVECRPDAIAVGLREAAGMILRQTTW
jgi:histidinol-phosphate phosphatase family protein